MGAFGTVIPVVGLNNGFLGNVTRLGKRGIAAREVLSTTPSNINFGDPVVLIPDSLGGTWQSVKDFVAGGGAFSSPKLAGVAVREVKTNLSFSASNPPGTAAASIGYYAPASLCEALEEGSINVKINVGTPVAGNNVYIRTVANSGIPAGVVGGFEAANDNSVNTTASAASSNSTSLSITSATGVVVGQIITGVGIPANTVVTVVSGTTLTLSNAATVASGAALNFSNTALIAGVVFRTGVLDANNVSEITLLNRLAA